MLGLLRAEREDRPCENARLLVVVPGCANDPVITLEPNGDPRREVDVNARAGLVREAGVQGTVELGTSAHVCSAEEDLGKWRHGRNGVRGNPWSSQVAE